MVDDTKLVNLALKNPDDFKLIIDKYKNKLFWYIRRLSNVDEEEIEDLLQEIFIKVYRNLNSYKQDLKFSSWLYRIARNEVISNHRKLKARPQGINLDWEIKDEILNSMVSDFNLEDDMEARLLSDSLVKTLGKMDIKYKEVIVYKYFEEKTYQEISDILKKPPGTIATLLNRAKKQFVKIAHKENIKLYD